MRKSSYMLIFAPVVLAATCVSSVFVSMKRWDDAEEEHSRLGPTRWANKLVMRDLEGIKADQGRYPEKLKPTDVPDFKSTKWYYRANTEGTDYELWCEISRKDSGFDALVFSPDGVIGDDWPGERTSPGDVWTLVEHAELAPADRWRDPVNP